MKKITLILLAFVLVASACKKKDDEAEEGALNPTAAQKGFAIEYTSTTCSICGASGGPLVHQWAKDAPHSVVIALHVNGNSDKMANNQLSWGYDADRPCGQGIPSFWVGDKHTNAKDAMQKLVKSGDAIAGIDLKYTREGNKMKVETLTKFFAAGSGDYNISVYILENGIDGSSNAPEGYVQTGGTYSHPNDDYKHDFVMRAASAGNNVMGELLVSNPSKGKEISKSFSISLDSSWKKKLYAVAVIWKHDASATIKYSYINAMRK